MPKRKASSDPHRTDRNPASRSVPEGPSGDDTSRSVLGGLRGGYRITSDQNHGGEDIISLIVPFEEKGIVCQLYRASKSDQPSEGESKGGDELGSESGKSDDEGPPSKQLQWPSLIFTHGAGGGLANPATADFCRGVSSMDACLAMQGTMNLKSRIKTFNAVAEHVRESFPTSSGRAGSEAGAGKIGGHSNARLALGGRSMGARASTISANELGTNLVNKLVLVSYPLTAEKGGGMEERAAPLYEVSEDVPVLFVIGDQDHMCPKKELKRVRSKMKASSWVVWVKGADHTMSVKGGKENIWRMRRETGRIAGEWAQNRSEERNGYVEVDDEGQVRFLGWMSEEGRQGEGKKDEDEDVDKDVSKRRRKEM